MPEDAVVVVPAGWAVLAAVILCGLAFFAVTFDAVLSARAQGVSGGWSAPLSDTARLLRQRRRKTVAADTLLWRVGRAGVVIGAVLMVAVVPVGQWTLAGRGVGDVWFSARDLGVWAVVWRLGWVANATHRLGRGY